MSARTFRRRIAPMLIAQLLATAATARRRKPRRSWEEASRHYGESA